MPKCTATKKLDGSPCRANAKGDSGFCRWHSKLPEDVAAHLAQSRKGGETKAYGFLVSTNALLEDPALEGVDLNTPAGLRQLYAAQLRRLASLPFDVRVSAAMTQAGIAQRSVIELGEVADKLAQFDEFMAEQRRRK